MKHINPILSVPFKVTCRKTILAAALFCGFSMMANAQIQDGRDFSMDGFAAYEGTPGTNWGGHIWVDHCEVFNGDAANKDRYDGLLDCKNNVQWMTFSYNYFHDHNKSCLWGKGDSDVYDNCRTISFHHNFFDNIQGSRLPLQRGGHVHYYNNYMRGCEDGWDIRTGAVAFVQACYFENTKSPIRSDRGGSLNISKAEGYDCIYKGCNNLMEGYTNVDGAKISKSLPVTKTDWVPTQTTSSYTQHYLDKTVDVPAICEKYSGAGKVEIWKAYTDVLPTADIAEFDHAIKNYDTAKTFDANGNTMSGATTGILFAEKTSEAGTSRIEYYDLAGSRLSAPQKGINIVKKINFDGIASVKKVIF